MRPGRMQNGKSRFAARLGAWIVAGRAGGVSAGEEFAWEMASTATRGRSAGRLGGAPLGEHPRALDDGRRAPHPTRLETRTKESDVRASRWARKPCRRKEFDRWDPRASTKGCTADRSRSCEKGSSGARRSGPKRW